jgi:hypothetical protein
MKKSIAGHGALMAFALAVLVASTGCQQNAAPAAAVPAVPFGFKEIRIGATADVGAQVHPQILTTGDPVVVTMITKGQPKDVELAARFIALGTGQEVDQKLQLSAATPSPIVMRFDPSPKRTPGRYLLELKLDGKLAEHRNVDIAPGSTPPSAASPTGK